VRHAVRNRLSVEYVSTSNVVPKRRGRHQKRLAIHSTLWIGGSTVGSVIAVLYFRPTLFDLLVLAVCYFISNIGISVGFHRLLAHRSFEASSFLWYLLLIMGCSAAQGSPSYWVILHRQHHRFSDKDGDPHSPIAGYRAHQFRGFLHAHFGWISNTRMLRPDRASNDLFQDRSIQMINDFYYPLAALGVLIPAISGWLYYENADGALRGALWGGAVRLLLVHHIIWSINSFCHLCGTQSYDTGDASRNNWILALFSVGESWHNNHHIAPASARFGHTWWQLDIGYIFIGACCLLGLARRPRPLPLKFLAAKKTSLQGP